MNGLCGKGRCGKLATVKAECKCVDVVNGEPRLTMLLEVGE